MSEKIIVGSQNFSGGLVTVKPAHLLEEGQTPSCQNVDFSESVGRLTKRKGYSKFMNANQGSSYQTVGLHQYIQDDGTQFLLAAVNDDVYSIATASTWTSIHTDASNNGKRVRFANFRLTSGATQASAIFVGEELTTQKWSGSGSSSNLLGTPPSNARYITVHRNKVWIACHGIGNTPPYKSRINYSASLNAEDWTTASDAGHFDIDPGDGDEITGICSIGASLLVFKKWATYIIRGDTATTFKVSKISANIGCVAPDSIVRCDTFAIFLSNQGVYAATDTGVALLSYNIKPTIDALSDTVKAAAVACRLRTQYWLSYDSDADGKNDEVLYLDFVFGIWGKYTNKKIRCALTRLDGTLLTGSSATDEVHLHDDTDNDDGSAINMIWDTPDYDGGKWECQKQAHDIIVGLGPISGKNLTVAHLLNGIVQGTTITKSLTPVSTEDKIFLKQRHLPDTSYSPYIRFRFSNNETSARLIMYGYSLVLNVLERANG